MPIQNIPYTESLATPQIERGWRSWFESVYRAVRGWRETESANQANPFQGVLLGAHTVSTQTTTPSGLGPIFGDIVVLQPNWDTGAEQTVLFTAKATTIGTLVWYAYNYGTVGVTIANASDLSFRVLLIHQ